MHRQASAGVRLELARRVEGDAAIFEVDSIGQILISVYAGRVTSCIERSHLPIIVEYIIRLSFSNLQIGMLIFESSGRIGSETLLKTAQK